LKSQEAKRKNNKSWPSYIALKKKYYYFSSIFFIDVLTLFKHFEVFDLKIWPPSMATDAIYRRLQLLVIVIVHI